MPTNEEEKEALLQQMIEDLANHDLEKLRSIINDRMSMLGNIRENQAYTLVYGREIIILAFEWITATLNYLHADTTRAEAQQMILEKVYTLLTDYIEHNP